jgi:hypothetical protein
MRNGQNKRMRGRSRNKGHNPLTRVYESNGPDVKIRGTASHVAEKYQQLARDAHASGDPIAAENYQQHAEHYYRLIAAAQEQFRQNNPYYQGNRPEGGMQDMRGNDDGFDDGDDDGPPQPGEQPAYGGREPQPYLPRDAQFYPREQQQRPPQPMNQGGGDDGNVARLPSFITGGGQQVQPSYGQPHQQPGNGGGYDNQERQGGADRFPLHRRRRRHRGPRNDMSGMQDMGGHDGGDDASPSGE